MDSYLLRLRDVSKEIAGQYVLNDLMLEIKPGRAVAIVGANGSGKSTLLKILSGLGKFDKGQRIVESSEGRLSIGYVPERFPKLNFNAVDYLRSMGKMQGIPGDKLSARIEELVTRFGLDPADRRTMKRYSKGMLQKVNLIQGMLAAPELLLLDEPFSGLDHNAQEELVAALNAIKRQGQAIVMTTHEPSFVERVADRTLRLRDGRLSVADDRSAQEPLKRLEFELHDPSALQSNAVSRFQRQGSSCVAWVERKHSDSVIRAILEAGGSIAYVGDERTGNVS
ncbi:ABC transporter ATP-binding protein [Cohnella panacarvi]|uniref:ABC transporter ATP-binding protein n=1 Tax=Cohnella panacarvi TaxID=400776 RepID=UPI0004788B1C|nr:ABC transporter ATP-binding protein [Cohnella panacarvi]